MPGEQTHDFARLRVPMQLRFLEDRLAIDCDFKAPTGARQQADVGANKCFPNLGRQTGGPRLVVSKRTVFDADLHGALGQSQQQLSQRVDGTATPARFANCRTIVSCRATIRRNESIWSASTP